MKNVVKNLFISGIVALSTGSTAYALNLVNETDYNLEVYILEPDTDYKIFNDGGPTLNVEKTQYYNDYSSGCHKIEGMRPYYRYNILYSEKEINGSSHSANLLYNIPEISEEPNKHICVYFQNADNGSKYDPVAGTLKPVILSPDCKITVAYLGNPAPEIVTSNCEFAPEPA